MVEFKELTFAKAANGPFAVLISIIIVLIINGLWVPESSTKHEFPMHVAVPDFKSSPVGMILLKNNSNRTALFEKVH